MSSKDRSSSENGVWLCHACSRLIDSDVAGHPVPLLQSWRWQAEAEAKRRLVVPPLTEADVLLRMQSTLSALPTPQSLWAVSNVHQATQAFLNSLDDRVTVESSYVGGRHQLELRPNVSVDFELTCMSADAHKAHEALQRLFAHGEKASLEVEQTLITGSPLLEYLVSSGGPARIELTPIPRPVTLRLALRSTDDRKRIFEELPAEAVFGSESMTASGHAFGGLIALSMRVDPDTSGEVRRQAWIRIDTQHWHDKDIRFLSEFERLNEFINQIFEGGRLCIEAVLEDRQLIGLDVTDVVNMKEMKDFRALIAYTERARRIAGFFSVRVPFVHGHEFYGKDIQTLDRCARACEGILRGSWVGDLEAVLGTADVPDDVLGPAKPFGMVRTLGAPSGTVQLFKKVVKLSQLLIDVPVRTVSVEPLEDGAKVRVLVRPVDGELARYFFQTPESSGMN